MNLILRQKIGLIFLVAAFLLAAQPAMGMNKAKDWVNNLRPGTFSTEGDASSDTAGGDDVNKFSESDVKVLIQLKAREAALKKKEEEFAKRTGELKLLSQQIEQKLDQMRNLAGKIEEMRQQRKQMDEKDVTRMVKYYETMSADATAQFINQMDRVTAMHLLMRMNPRKASAVMQLLEPKVAVEITEKVTRFKENRSELKVNP